MLEGVNVRDDYMRRAVDEYSGLEQDFDDDEFFEWLAELADGMDEE